MIRKTSIKLSYTYIFLNINGTQGSLKNIQVLEIVHLTSQKNLLFFINMSVFPDFAHKTQNHFKEPLILLHFYNTFDV